MFVEDPLRNAVRLRLPKRHLPARQDASHSRDEKLAVAPREKRNVCDTGTGTTSVMTAPRGAAFFDVDVAMPVDSIGDGVLSL